MHIARAYCVEADRIVDIYQARALFFAQDQPRRRFEFLCSDGICRAVNATRVTGVNYDKLVERGDHIVQKPHFRANPHCSHIGECEWVVRERELQTPPSDRELQHGRGSQQRFRGLKSSDVVDVFMPTHSSWVDTELTDDADPIPRTPGNDTDAALSRRRAASWSGVTRADFLGPVVSTYELLEADERDEASLRIGGGRMLSYRRAFCRVEHYFDVSAPRIFHGEVRVRVHGPNFAVRFFDGVGAAVDHHGGDVTLYFKRERLLDHWNGKFLVAQLTEAAKPGYYAHCYLFGRIASHPTKENRMIVEVESLDHLVFTVRTRIHGAATSPLRPAK